MSPRNSCPCNNDDHTSLSILDIVANSEQAIALKATIETSPGHSYVYPDLADVKLLKDSIMDSRDESIITHMGVETNKKAAEYRKWIYSDVSGGET